MSNLFKPLRIGNVNLSNRIVLAPLTRLRASDEHVPLPFVADYYAQRASYPGTFLITEATAIAPQGTGKNNIPGIWNDAQINSWKHVTEAVHAKGSSIFLQLWFLGRAASLEQLKKEYGEDAKVVSSSDIPFPGGDKPTPLTETEIEEIIGLYAQGAKNAIAAGFDGVEIHAANGYLIDQFTQDVANQRTDKWGGSVENRARFGIEVAKAVVNAVGADKTGIRFSPYSEFQGMHMADPVPQFSYLVGALKELKLAYIHVVVVDSRAARGDDVAQQEKVDWLIDLWGKTSPVLLAGGFQPGGAKAAVDEEYYKDKDIGIVFGRHFISNPDLVFRIKEDIPTAKYDRNKFYTPKAEDGYITYPFSKEFQESQARL